ncbi:MAG: S8 family peptidase [Bacteroidales bacterium]|nr:S8 family peptidase [Bacteroidales bacterium]
MKKLVLLLISSFCLFCTTDIKSQSVGSGLNAFIAANNLHTKGQKTAFAQRFVTEKIKDTEYISLIMRVDRECDLSFLKKYDCIFGSKTGRIVTVKVNVKELEKFIKEKDIIEVDVSRLIGGENLKYAVNDFNAPDIWAGTDLSQSYTGKDVLIGVADWGIDYTHPTFYDTLGEQYRIVAAWDQFRKEGPAPEFGYGTELYGKDMLLEAQHDTANQLDTGYHATHVGGIAGGCGAGTEYKGVATEAGFLFCTFIPDEVHYIDGCRWMRSVAKSLNKRLVINNSWGVYNLGCMDGTSMLDEFINTFSDEDSVVFVVSAGNNGGSFFHLKADFNEGQNDTVRSEIEFNFPTPYTNDYWGEAVTLQSENGQEFSSKLEFYDYRWDKIGETPLMISDGSVVEESVFMVNEQDSIIYRGSSRYPQDKKALVDWDVRQSRYKNNTTHIVLVVTATNGVVHAWNLNRLSKAVGNTGFQFKASQNGFVAGDSQYGVSEPALAENAITVAAHKFRNTSWRPEIASFSSCGPNMTPYMKPEISAPGYSVVSSLSSFSNTAPTATETVTFNGKEYGFGPASGTSMSGPMVAGSVALILQANPTLTPREVKQLIIESAKTDEHTGECPNDTWGYGKLNAYQAVKAAEKKVGLIHSEDNTVTVFPIPAKTILYIEGLETDSEISVFDIYGRKAQIRKINEEAVDIRSLSSGVYVLNINNKGKNLQLKFIKK